MLAGSNGWNNSNGTIEGAWVSKTLNGIFDSMHSAMSHKCLETCVKDYQLH